MLNKETMDALAQVKELATAELAKLREQMASPAIVAHAWMVMDGNGRVLCDAGNAVVMMVPEHVNARPYYFTRESVAEQIATLNAAAPELPGLHAVHKRDWQKGRVADLTSMLAALN